MKTKMMNACLLMANARALLPPTTSAGYKVTQSRSKVTRLQPSVKARSYSSCLRFQNSDIVPVELPFVPVLLIAAVGLLVAAQTLINRQLEGDQGLGAFLRDGSGYSKSGFRPLSDDSDRAVSRDPLPWMKLPELDFVQVAGQEKSTASEEEILQQLESLRNEMNLLLQAEKTEEAIVTRRELERLMVENGMEYNADY